MIVCLPVTADGQVGGGWGRADRVAVAVIDNSGISSWDEIEVGWGQSHDQDGEGSHHARIARFLTDHKVTCVIAGHMGPPMEHMLNQMQITVRLGASGDARAAATLARV